MKRSLEEVSVDRGERWVGGGRRAAGGARLICWVKANFVREHREQGPPDLAAAVDDGQVDSVRGRSNVMDTWLRVWCALLACGCSSFRAVSPSSVPATPD